MEFAQLILESLTSGGPNAVIALLCAVITLLIWDRIRLLKEIDRKELKLEKIIDDYYKGNITITEALNGLKIVLAEIKGKL